MAKTMNQSQTSNIQGDGKQKALKKQAKREAKTMLAVEKARSGVEKAQRKYAKVKGRLDSLTARLHTLENKLSDVRSTPEQDHGDSSKHGQNGQSKRGKKEKTQKVSLPTAEGRSDMLHTNDTTGKQEQSSASSEASQADNQQEHADSVPEEQGKDENVAAQALFLGEIPQKETF